MVVVGNFEQLWQKHFEWSLGVLVEETRKGKTADFYLIPSLLSEFYNFALPKIKTPIELNLKEIRRTFEQIRLNPCVYLWEKQIKSGFPGFLEKKDFKFFGTDTWMVFSKKAFEKPENIEVRHISVPEFEDFRIVLADCFKEWPGNEQYLQMCYDSLTGKAKSKNTPDLSSEFFVIYENSKPVAGAGLFVSEKEKTAYFHNDGTLEKYRGKGYHGALILKRIDYCLKRGIEILYSIVEYESQSFRNYSRCGFEVWQGANLFALKK